MSGSESKHLLKRFVSTFHNIWTLSTLQSSPMKLFLRSTDLYIDPFYPCPPGLPSNPSRTARNAKPRSSLSNPAKARHSTTSTMKSSTSVSMSGWRRTESTCLKKSNGHSRTRQRNPPRPLQHRKLPPKSLPRKLVRNDLTLHLPFNGK
jgi:hypothetical protein